VIKASDGGKSHEPGNLTPMDDSSAQSDDEGLGGCKFLLMIRFDGLRLIQTQMASLMRACSFRL
jgi:hypothetical protein